MKIEEAILLLELEQLSMDSLNDFEPEQPSEEFMEWKKEKNRIGSWVGRIPESDYWKTLYSEHLKLRPKAEYHETN